MNPKHALLALTSPLEPAPAVKIAPSRMFDVPKTEYLAVRYAVHSFHVVSIHAINHVIDLENVSHVLRLATNPRGYADIPVLLNVMLRLDVPRTIHASTLSCRLVHVETFNQGHHAELRFRVNRGNRHN